ncbi:MAG: hypothetical protein IH984_14390 [Planctomycetes bacterium]|nr:hypothetical protein [Planctomycetota bacterium]
MTQIPATSPVDSALQSTSVNRFSDMSSEDFIRIIFTELANQDPLAPNDSGALLQQISSIRSIESDMQLIEQLKSLVTENQLAAASNLIGKHVTGLTINSDAVEGNVVSISREGETIAIKLDNGYSIPFESIDTISAAVPKPTTGVGTNAG